jgi:hypothetical protein
MTKATAVFSSRLAPALKQYVDLKRALGRRFDEPARTLQLLDVSFRTRLPSTPT